MTDSPTVPRICLATIAREQVSMEYHVSVVRSMDRLAFHIVAPSGPYLDAGRNKAIAWAMNIRNSDAPDALPWDWLLFVDSDIEFTPEHIDVLFAPTLHASYKPSRYPIIGGIYVNPFDDGGVEGDIVDPNHAGFLGPVCYEWAERDDLPGQLQGVPTPTFIRLSAQNLRTRPPVEEAWNPPSPDDASPSPVTRVDAIGTGFLAIHASLLHVMASHFGEPLPWFHEPVVHAVHYGEDMGFALRARDLGYPVLAHRGCTVLHRKTIKLT